MCEQMVASGTCMPDLGVRAYKTKCLIIHPISLLIAISIMVFPRFIARDLNEQCEVCFVLGIRGGRSRVHKNLKVFSHCSGGGALMIFCSRQISYVTCQCDYLG